MSVDQVLDKLSSSRWVPLAANLAALVLLVYGLTQWTWRLLQPATPSAGISQPQADPNQSSLDLQTLLSANLFGQAQTAGLNPQQLPLSSLNLVLTGIMAQGNSRFAFVSVNGAPEAPVMVGQEVTAGAILDSVRADRIILRRGGALESVLLKDIDATLPAGSILTAPTPSSVKPLGGGRYSVDRQALSSMTAESLTQASVAPSPGGLVVKEIQAGSMFEKLGLRAGDVVRSVNGQPVHSIDDAAKAYGQFASASPNNRVTVEVVRGGKTEILQYQMQ